jgi:hypothetical protein
MKRTQVAVLAWASAAFWTALLPSWKITGHGAAALLWAAAWWGVGTLGYVGWCLARRRNA